ncbi:hypothetical protein THIOM_004193 [Candidatus Thiomargarita nelsonii]|uniref:Uncharacterized protein n=1 Tax=Candidatus Thiomargarita nelsonii TaxID=1003181 RepID=A0A176RWN3_9GAMM|nr:hypothetical protein THIOM_004193 [Candidatus Thiomargarita nelsonii]
MLVPTLCVGTRSKSRIVRSITPYLITPINLVVFPVLFVVEHSLYSLTIATKTSFFECHDLILSFSCSCFRMVNHALLTETTDWAASLRQPALSNSLSA